MADVQEDARNVSSQDQVKVTNEEGMNLDQSTAGNSFTKKRPGDSSLKAEQRSHSGSLKRDKSVTRSQVPTKQGSFGQYERNSVSLRPTLKTAQEARKSVAANQFHKRFTSIAQNSEQVQLMMNLQKQMSPSMSPVSGQSFGENPDLRGQETQKVTGLVARRKRRYQQNAPGRQTAEERKNERAQYKKEKHDYYMQQLIAAERHMVMTNAYKTQAKYADITDYLHFKKGTQKEQEIKKGGDQLRAQRMIAQLYAKNVPSYLLEDHPTEFPETAKNLVQKVGQTKGNGMPAEQLDQELAILFQNNQQKKEKKSAKKDPDFVDQFTRESDDEEQMQEWVQQQKEHIEERDIKRRVLQEKQEQARKERQEQRLRNKQKKKAALAKGQEPEETRSTADDRKNETQEGAQQPQQELEADQQTGLSSHGRDQRSPSPEEQQYKIAEKLYNKLFVDRSKYQHVQDQPKKSKQWDLHQPDQINSYLHEYHQKIAKLNGYQYKLDDKEKQQKQQESIEDELQDRFRSHKSVERCQSQLEQRRKRRIKQGLPIYDHNHVSYEQYVETTSKFSKYDQYDERQHLQQIRKKELEVASKDSVSKDSDVPMVQTRELGLIPALKVQETIKNKLLDMFHQQLAIQKSKTSGPNRISIVNDLLPQNHTANTNESVQNVVVEAPAAAALVPVQHSTSFQKPPSQKRSKTAQRTPIHKKSKEEKEHEFYNTFASRFMPIEHQGVNPSNLVLTFNQTSPGTTTKVEYRHTTPIENKAANKIKKYNGKSPLFRAVEIPDTPEPGDENSLTVLAQIDDAVQLQKELDVKLEENEDYVERMFNKKRMSRQEIEKIRGEAFIRQFAKKYPSGVQRAVVKRGHINAGDFRDTALERKALQRAATSITQAEETDAERKQRAEFWNKVQANNAKLSFVEQLSNNNKVNDLTAGFKAGCDSSHPSYKTGYIPRHYNYLKSNKHTHQQLTGQAVRDLTPALLTKTNQHLNNNILTRDAFFSSSTQPGVRASLNQSAGNIQMKTAALGKAYKIGNMRKKSRIQNKKGRSSQEGLA